MIARWIALWDHREHPRSLAAVRVLLGAVILWEFLDLARLGLVVPLFADATAGGFGSAATGPWWTALVVPDATVARAWHGALVLAALGLLTGCFTRASAAVLLVLWARHAEWLPDADRGIDVLCRNALALLACSGAGRAWSVDAWRASGRLAGDDAPVPAWPRYLLIVQILAMYLTAGMYKIGALWLPHGGFAALYVVLQDPAVARHDYAWMAAPPWFLLTRVATAATVAWEWSAPLVLCWLWLRATSARGGRLRALALRVPVHLVYLGVGVVFHAGLHALLLLGIFPVAMVALYPAFVHPNEWALLRRGTWLR